MASKLYPVPAGQRHCLVMVNTAGLGLPRVAPPVRISRLIIDRLVRFNSGVVTDRDVNGLAGGIAIGEANG